MMLTANQIKFIRSLSQKKYRDENGLFIVEGEKNVKEALNSDFNVKAIYRIEEIGQKSMERITSLSSPSPVLAIVEQRKKGLFDEDEQLLSYLSTHKDSLFLALDNLKDPGNLGTIIRVADWFGIDAIFAAPQTVELYNPKTVQATMGSIFRMPVIYRTLPELLELFKKAGMPIFATTLQGENIYTLKSIKKRGIIIIGSESFGVSDTLIKLADNELLIPSYPQNSHKSDSLNAAIATAIICAEFRR